MSVLIKKETITLSFNFDENEVNIVNKRNKYIKDVIEQYLIKIKKVLYKVSIEK